MSLGDHNSLGREVVCLLPSLPVGGMLGSGVVGGANGMVASIIAVSLNCMATECRYVSSHTHNTYVCTYIRMHIHTQRMPTTHVHTPMILAHTGAHMCTTLQNLGQPKPLNLCCMGAPLIFHFTPCGGAH